MCFLAAAIDGAGKCQLHNFSINKPSAQIIPSNTKRICLTIIFKCVFQQRGGLRFFSSGFGHMKEIWKFVDR